MNAYEFYVTKYMFALESIAHDNSHGYSNIIDDNLGQNGDYDCGGFISKGLQCAGLLSTKKVFEPNSPTGTWGYDTILTSIGFAKHQFNESELLRGDILIKDGTHTEVYTGNGQLGAHANYDGVRGDYGDSGEISEVPLSKNYWDYYYRLEDIPCFTDITNKESSYQHIEKMAKYGIFKGFEDGSFRGDKLMTRKDVAVAISRLLSLLGK